MFSGKAISVYQFIACALLYAAFPHYFDYVFLALSGFALLFGLFLA